MSDTEENVDEKPFVIERAKQGRAVCKKCKQKCLQGEWRLAKLVSNPFGAGKMKAWHHINCLFEMFLKQRKTTKRIEGPDDIDGWDILDKDVQKDIIKLIEECDKFHGKSSNSPKKQQKNQNTSKQENTIDCGKDSDSSSPSKQSKNKTQSFKEFRKLIAEISNTDSYLDKTNCIKLTFDKNFCKDDIILWCRLLLPGVVKRVYNLQSKQLVKLFSRLFVADQSEMLEHLEQGDIGETIQTFFERSIKVQPAKKSLLTVNEVDTFLSKLSDLTREEDQIELFKSFIPKCTSNDLKIVIRLIKGDLRMGAGAKHVLDAIDSDAYESYQTSRDLALVINKCLTKTTNSTKGKTADVLIMTPVLPMLAEACKSVDYAIKKCPHGMYSEIKYDGERVQVHKRGSEFKYFSRALKPVLPHKIAHFKDYIPKAFPNANDLILDSEILMMDTVSGKPLPFGTLGVHKKTEFKDATVCLFVFDCIYFNGESLINKPLSVRKKILHDNMFEIPNHIMFSEMQEIHKKNDLANMIAKVLRLGLEGLVLKDTKSTYEPGKRHWLKVKKDYLFDGAMADSADLIVLGAWYGTGKKGGMMSVFLMGCYNPEKDIFCTVTKVHTGHDDKTLEQLQTELDMIKISQDANKVPRWLKCTKTMIPDFVAKDPKKQPVWEITGAEFTQHDVHTANGISIRFPRVTRIRNDKNWESATNIHELQALYTTSKENLDISLLVNDMDSSESQNDKQNIINKPKKRKNLDECISNSSSSSSPKKKQKIEDNKIEETNSSLTTNTSNDSTNENKSIFSGVKALLEDELKKDKYADVIRSFIDCGGELLLDQEQEEATHVIHYYNIIREPIIKCPIIARHVSYEWITDSIEEGTTKNHIYYTVQWNPDE